MVFEELKQVPEQAIIEKTTGIAWYLSIRKQDRKHAVPREQWPLLCQSTISQSVAPNCRLTLHYSSSLLLDSYGWPGNRDVNDFIKMWKERVQLLSFY
jgi:hypothetical protein